MTHGKVILVTHSMGGIVARRAAQKEASKIIEAISAKDLPAKKEGKLCSE